MKKISIILFLTGLLISCNSAKDHQTTRDSVTTEVNHEDHEKKQEGLVLNNGAKWKADSITLVNIALLQNIATKSENKGLEDYQQTAAELESGLNKMVQECKMQGAAHDALHAWLEPVIEKTKELKKQTSVDKAAPNLKDIVEQLNLFPQYFEK